MANFSLLEHVPQSEGEMGLSQKEFDRDAMFFIGAIVFQGQNEFAVRLPFRFDRHRVRKEFKANGQSLVLGREAFRAIELADERLHVRSSPRDFGEFRFQPGQTLVWPAVDQVGNSRSGGRRRNADGWSGDFAFQFFDQRPDGYFNLEMLFDPAPPRGPVTSAQLG